MVAASRQQDRFTCQSAEYGLCGRVRVDESAYLQRTYRDGGKVKNETVANLSVLPSHVIGWIDAGLKSTAWGIVNLFGLTSGVDH